MYCGQSVCAYGAGPRYDFAIAIYSSEVTIEEDTPPSVGALTVAGGSDGWVNGDATVGFSGSDALGIRAFELLRDGAVAARVDRTCVDWSVRPCSEPTAGLSTGANGTRTIKDLVSLPGAHQLAARAIDGAGNTATSAPVSVTVDNSGYSTMYAIGDGSLNAEQRSLTWFAVGDGAPLVSGSAHLCIGTGANPGNCQDMPVDPHGPLAFALPGDGSTATAAITLTDAAGNTTTSSTYRFARDASAPGAPTLALAGSSGNDRSVAIGGEAGTTFTAKLCAAGSSVCADVARGAAPATITVPLITPGEYDLVATLTDAAGNTSAPGTLRLTRSAPLSEPKSMNLSVRVTSNLRKKRINVRGSLSPGAASKIDVQLIGKKRSGRRVTSHATITVPASGTFTKKLSPPKGASPTRQVQLVLTPSPNDGWRVTRYTHTIRP